MKHRIGKERRFNCWLLALVLWWKGRIVRVRRTGSGSLPHVVGVTRRERRVHFRRTRGRQRKCSLWYVGVIEVYGRADEDYAATILG